MSFFVVTMRTSTSYATKRYKKETGAMRAMHNFLMSKQGDDTRLVIYTSPSNPIRTFTDTCEFDFNIDKNIDFYKTKRWLKLRFEVLSHFGAKCMCCFSSAEDGAKIDVDHVYPRANYPQLEYEKANLQVLCSDCNIGKLNVFIKDFRAKSFKDELAKKATELGLDIQHY